MKSYHTKKERLEPGQKAVEVAAAAARQASAHVKELGVGKKKKEASPLALPPRGFRCQEASPLSRTKYIACGTPATRVVKQDDGHTLAMCSGCADHNVTNRGARYVLRGEDYHLNETLGAPRQTPPHLQEPADPGFEVEAASDGPSDDDRASVAKLCREARELELEIAEDAEELSRKQERLREMKEKTLVDALKSIGVREVPLWDGTKVQVKDLAGGYIKADNKARAFAALEEMGEDALIKRKLVAEFTNTEEDRKWFEKVMRDNAKRKKPLNLTVDMSVHPQTLSAWVRECLRTGVEIDKELFGVYEIQRADIVAPKEKKQKGGM